MAVTEKPEEDVSASESNRMHRKSDVDAGKQSQHHTLGPSQVQAAPGNHLHNGYDSSLLLSGFTLTGAKGGNAAVASIVSALVQLGATDATTA